MWLHPVLLLLLMYENDFARSSLLYFLLCLIDKLPWANLLPRPFMNN